MFPHKRQRKRDQFGIGLVLSLIGLLTSLLVATPASAASATLRGAWLATTAMPVNAQPAQGVLMKDGRVLFTGLAGSTTAPDPHGYEIFNPLTVQWTSGTTTYDLHRTTESVTAFGGDNVLLGTYGNDTCNGINGPGTSYCGDNWYSYDGTANTWSTVSAPPSNSLNGSAKAVEESNGNVLLIGG